MESFRILFSCAELPSCFQFTSNSNKHRCHETRSTLLYCRDNVMQVNVSSPTLITEKVRQCFTYVRILFRRFAHTQLKASVGRSQSQCGTSVQARSMLFFSFQQPFWYLFPGKVTSDVFTFHLETYQLKMKLNKQIYSNSKLNHYWAVLILFLWLLFSKIYNLPVS